jgi:hypothetical protein
VAGGQDHDECRSGIRRTAGGYFAVMALYDAAAYGQSHSRTGIRLAIVQALEWREDSFEVPLFESDAVVFEEDPKCNPLQGTFVRFRADADDRLLSRPVEFQGVSDQVLKKLPHLRRIGVYFRKIPEFDPSADFG